MAENVVYGDDQNVAQFVKGLLGSGYENCDYVALGVIHERTLVAGVVYFNYRHGDIEFSMASTSPRWIRRAVIRRLFEYPFVTAKCERVTALVRENNHHVIEQVRRLGFREEGRKRSANNPEIYFGLLKSECRWLKD